MAKYKVEITGINTANIKSLSNEENIELLKKYHQTKEKKIKDQLVKGNLKLVLSLVNKFQKRADNLDDVFQVGVLGLIKAIDNFSLEADVLFSTYAVPMVDGEIRRYLRDYTPLRVSRQIKDLSYQVLREKEKALEFGKIPTLEELATKFQTSEKKIMEALDANMPVQSLTDPMFSDDKESLSLLDVIPTTENTSEKTLLRISLKQGLDNLTKLEREIIILRYFRNKSQVEIASIYQISQAQVSRIEKAALTTLRKYV